jgi:hypothetical protein
MKTHKQLLRTISLLVLQALCDYITMCIWAYEIIIYDGTPYINVPNSLANGYQILFSLSAMHFLISVFAFIQFKRLFVSGNVVDVVSKGTKSAFLPRLVDVVKKDHERKEKVVKY